MALVLNKKVTGLNLLDYEKIDFKNNDEETAEYKVAILNLMPNKYETEYQFLNLLGKSDKKIGVYFIRMKSYKSKNTDEEYLKKNYYSMEDIKNKEIDGFIITGAPIEKIKFEDVIYWNEFKKILDYIDKHIKTALFICWGAQAALYKYYGIQKVVEDKKVFGVFNHNIQENCNLLKGIKDGFWAPHSRYSNLNKIDLYKNKEVKVISSSEDVGEYILTDSNNRFYILGHCEYGKYDLKNEYTRDIDKGINTSIPKNYFKDNNPKKNILFTWNDDAQKLYLNWINYLK